MARCIVKLTDNADRDYYLEWSTVCDAPITQGMSLEKFREYYYNKYGEASELELTERLLRVEANGTSAYSPENLESLLQSNRAGDNEECLSKSEVIAKYCNVTLSVQDRTDAVAIADVMLKSAKLLGGVIATLGAEIATAIDCVDTALPEKTRILKTCDPYFEMVWDRVKTFELRKNDRNFQVGERYCLAHFDAEADEFLGRWVDVRITCIVATEHLVPGYVALGIEEIERSRITIARSKHHFRFVE